MGRPEYQWCDPNVSAGPTQGGHTDTDTYPLVLRPVGSTAKLCNAGLTSPIGFLSPTPGLTHFTHLHTSPS